MVDAGSRAKVTITAGGKRGEFYVGRNHEYNDRTEDGLYLTLFDYKGTYAHQAFDVADIPALIEALQSVADDFEALKPKEPTIADQMEAAPVGTLVVSSLGGTGWHKAFGGQWVSVYGDEHDAADFQNTDFSTFRIAYNPEEAN